MIVLTRVIDSNYYCAPGDTFALTVNDDFGKKIIIEETITVKKKINYIATFRFALGDGSCPSFNLCGIFANKDNLPEELKAAIYYKDLPRNKRKRFVRDVGILLK